MRNFIVLFCTFFYVSISLGQWNADPSINTPVGIAIQEQKDQRMKSDGDGGVFIVWKDLRPSGFVPDIYVQRLDSLGNPLWMLNGIGACTHVSDQSTPAIISDGKDGIIIVWSDRRNGIPRDIFAQRIDGNGNLMWDIDGMVVVDKAIGEHDHHIASDDNSGVIITWEEQKIDSTFEVRAQRLDSNGIRLWDTNGEFLSLSPGNRYNPMIQKDYTGGAYVVWGDKWGYDLYGQRLDKNGNRLWGNSGVTVCAESGVQKNVKIDPDKVSGGFFVSWSDSRNYYNDIYAQRVDSNGLKLWSSSGVSVCTADSSQSAVDILSNNKINGVIITWKDLRHGNYDIYAQKLDFNGIPQWQYNGISICDTAYDQKNPNIVSNKNGGAIITWQDFRNGLDWDVYAQNIDSNGNVLWANNGEPICTAPGDQKHPKNVPDNKGGSIFSWQDERVNGWDDIYAHHLFSNGLAIMCNIPITILPAQLCDGDSIILMNGTVITDPGMYNDTLTVTSGCDSILTHHVTTGMSSTQLLNYGFCPGDSVMLLDGSYASIAGTMNVTSANASGCEEIITYNITEFQETSREVSASICTGDTYMFDGNALTSAGIYTMVTPNVNGCDSTVTLTLLVNNSISTSEEVLLCGDQLTYTLVNGTVVSSAGIYTAITLASNDCDSIITYNISTCVGILNIEDNAALLVYPNPTVDVLNIEFSEKIHIRNSIDIINTLGQIVYSVENISELKVLVNTSEFREGLYYLNLVLDDKNYLKPFIVVK